MSFYLNLLILISFVVITRINGFFVVKTKVVSGRNVLQRSLKFNPKYHLDNNGYYKKYLLFSSKDENNVNDSKPKPKDLLAKYGSAYLLTSVSLSLFTFSLSYIVVFNRIDVSKLLEYLQIDPSDIAKNTGTFAIAYALHKALSPIRFPPTVALTPIVANWLERRKKNK